MNGSRMTWFAIMVVCTIINVVLFISKPAVFPAVFAIICAYGAYNYWKGNND